MINNKAVSLWEVIGFDLTSAIFKTIFPLKMPGNEPEQNHKLDASVHGQQTLCLVILKLLTYIHKSKEVVLNMQA